MPPLPRAQPVPPQPGVSQFPLPTAFAPALTSSVVVFGRLLAPIVLTAAQATVFIPVPVFRSMYELRFFTQTSAASAANVRAQFNKDTGANYYDNVDDFSNATTLLEEFTQTSGDMGAAPASASLNSGVNQVKIFVPQSNVGPQRPTWIYQDWRIDNAVAGGTHSQIGGGTWAGTPPLTSILLLLSGGSFVAGSWFELWG